MRIRLSLVVAISLCLDPGVDSQSGPSETERIAQLKAILQARGDAIQSVQADAKVSQHKGLDSAKMAEARRAAAANLRRNYPERAKQADWLEEDARWRLQPVPDLTRLYRIWLRGPTRIRIEGYGHVRSPDTERLGVAGGYHVEPTVGVYDGEHWYGFTPASRLGGAKDRIPETGRMGIDNEAKGHFPVLMATALGVPVGTSLEGLPQLSALAKQTDAMQWKELLELTMEGDSRAYDEQLPGGGPRLPVLELSFKPDENVGRPLFKFKLFLNPQMKYLPVRLERQDLVVGVPKTEPYYRMNSVIEWSEPITVSAGIVLPTLCTGHGFSDVVPIEEVNKPLGERRITSFATIMHRYVLSNVRINEEIDETRFRVQPPEGTTVADLASGQAYVVGPAGEALRKTAIIARDEFGQPIGAPVPFWKRPFVLALSGAIVGLVILAVVFRRQLLALLR